MNNPVMPIEAASWPAKDLLLLFGFLLRTLQFDAGANRRK